MYLYSMYQLSRKHSVVDDLVLSRELPSSGILYSCLILTDNMEHEMPNRLAIRLLFALLRAVLRTLTVCPDIVVVA